MNAYVGKNHTPFALVATCKCGNIVAAHMIIGGSKVGGRFTKTIERNYLKGGAVNIVDTRKQDVTIQGCNCIAQTINQTHK